MNIFKKFESFFGGVKDEYQKSVNSESFQNHLERTKGILSDTEEAVNTIGREVLDRSSTLLDKLQNLAVNLERSIQNAVSNSSINSDIPDEFDEIAQKVKDNVSKLEVKPDKLSSHIQDIDFEEIKQEYEGSVATQSQALIVHKDQVVKDLEKTKEDLEAKIKEVQIQAQNNKTDDKKVYEAKIIEISDQARQKANELLSGFRKEKDDFDQTVNDLNEKIASKFTTHMDKLKEIDRSVKSDFDRLIDKMKDKLGDE